MALKTLFPSFEAHEVTKKATRQANKMCVFMVNLLVVPLFDIANCMPDFIRPGGAIDEVRS